MRIKTVKRTANLMTQLGRLLHSVSFGLTTLFDHFAWSDGECFKILLCFCTMINSCAVHLVHHRYNVMYCQLVMSQSGRCCSVSLFNFIVSSCVKV